ncbi:uncharacterized protein CLUP02_08603 [Colletotrichum lupini]|uniref:Uncharacterized protein n=1 Tax=Colletotrichum lupini TaxID=145971 RepID=A0A9Q8SU57_9PEZI|nr:uncharacterized protein CLUP02_08603 [Colletotrichum lupini]UQC83110.1 hypothetical protein CLUP02_08603 [Colletotrichum lupini]
MAFAGGDSAFFLIADGSDFGLGNWGFWAITLGYGVVKARKAMTWGRKNLHIVARLYRPNKTGQRYCNEVTAAGAHFSLGSEPELDYHRMKRMEGKGHSAVHAMKQAGGAHAKSLSWPVWRLLLLDEPKEPPFVTRSPTSTTTHGRLSRIFSFPSSPRGPAVKLSIHPNQPDHCRPSGLCPSATIPPICMYLGWIPRGSPGPSFYLFLSWSTQSKSAHASFLPLSWMMGAGQPLARLVCAELATALAQVQCAKPPVGSCLLQ